MTVVYRTFDEARLAQEAGAQIVTARLDGQTTWFDPEGEDPAVVAFRIREGRDPSGGERLLGDMLNSSRPAATLARVLTVASTQ